MSRIDLANLKEVYAAALVKMDEEKEKRKRRHEKFLAQLKEYSDRFQDEISKEIDHNLLRAAKCGCRKTRWISRFRFHCRFGNVKVSALVYGWRTASKDVWDFHLFEEIGIKGTPFDEVVRAYKEKGIEVKNISKNCIGDGFWIEASF